MISLEHRDAQYEPDGNVAQGMTEVITADGDEVCVHQRLVVEAGKK